jgi:thiol-disulfide isomerase/thioredoxin
MEEGRMRLVVVMLALVAAAGCGAPVDNTPNRPAPSTGDYPAGPYGYTAGTTISNLSFIGKQSDFPTDYTQLPMQRIEMAELRKNAKFIVLDGAARWCGPCNRDQPAMKDLEATYAPQGVAFLEVLAEGGFGVPATENDINRWANLYQLSGIIAIDPELSIAKYADVTAFPVYLVVRTSTMKIEYMQVEAMSASPLGPVLDGLLASQ